MTELVSAVIVTIRACRSRTLAIAATALLGAVLGMLLLAASASAQPATAVEARTHTLSTPPASPSTPADSSPIPGLSLARKDASRVTDAATNALAGIGSNAASGFAGTVASSLFAPLTASLETAIAGLIGELGDFITATTVPQPMDASFLGPDGPYHAVASFSAALLVGFVFLGVAYGMVTGAPGQAVLRLLRDIPLAVLAIIGFPWLVDQLVNLSNALSSAILPTGQTAKELLTTQLLEQLKGAATQNPVPSFLIGLLTFLATVLVYMELVVRVILLQLIEALAPLSFAPLVWPPARQAAHKVGELTVAVILSQPAIFLALRVGLDFLHQHATASPSDVGAWGKLLLGLGVVFVATFAPWVIWRLIPHAEAMLVAQGLSRAPARAAMSGLQTAYWVTAMRSAIGGRRNPSPSTSSSGIGPPRSLPTPTRSTPSRSTSSGSNPPPSSQSGNGTPPPRRPPPPPPPSPPPPSPPQPSPVPGPNVPTPNTRGPKGDPGKQGSPGRPASPGPQESPGSRNRPTAPNGADPGWSRRRRPS